MGKMAENNDFQEGIFMHQYNFSHTESEVEVAAFLNNLNQKFYEKTAEEFSKTRQSPWSGWYLLLNAINDFLVPTSISSGSPLSVLDLGCGNGRFEKFLRENLPISFTGTGIDSDERLLEEAKKALFFGKEGGNSEGIAGADAKGEVRLGEKKEEDSFRYMKKDLFELLLPSSENDEVPKSNSSDSIASLNPTSSTAAPSTSTPSHPTAPSSAPSPSKELQLASSGFDLACSFGVMHHIYGEKLQRSLLEYMLSSLKAPGLLCVSFWQPQKSEKYQVQASENLQKFKRTYSEFPEGFLGENDIFLSWGNSDCLRYVHNFTGKEIEKLLENVLSEHSDLHLYNLYAQEDGNDRLNKYAVIAKDK